MSVRISSPISNLAAAVAYLWRDARAGPEIIAVSDLAKQTATGVSTERLERLIRECAQDEDCPLEPEIGNGAVRLDATDEEVRAFIAERDERAMPAGLKK